jgi:histone deacetylase complex regulatory component SIN3
MLLVTSDTVYVTHAFKASSTHPSILDAINATTIMLVCQVKMEFSDKPQIYNEFLDIMKNFKAQS